MGDNDTSSSSVHLFLSSTLLQQLIESDLFVLNEIGVIFPLGMREMLVRDDNKMYKLIRRLDIII